MFMLGAISYSGVPIDIGDDIPYSCMFDPASNSYFKRAFGTPSSSTKFTISVWLKRSLFSANQRLFAKDSGSTFILELGRANVNALEVYAEETATKRASNDLYRDPNSWMQVCVAADSSHATAQDRLRFWVDGDEITSWHTNNTITQNYAWLAATLYTIGAYGTGASLQQFGGYMADFIFIDGVYLGPSNFGRTSADTGQWVNKSYDGSYGYGLQGSRQEFNDPAFATYGLGKDTSGNNNHWTPVNITSANQYTDTPTNNFAVWDKLNLATTATLSAGNTKASASAVAIGSMGMSGAMKSYWEITSTGGTTTVGMYNTSATATTTVASGKTYGLRFNAAAGTLDYINITDAGSWTSLATGLSTFPYFQYASTGAGAVATLNSGSRPFAGTITTGYATLSSANLPASGVVEVSGSFTGNANADGPFVYCNGWPTTLSIDGNAVTFGTHADRVANGFKLRTASSPYNQSGTRNWTATIVSNQNNLFKYANAKGN